MESGGAAAVENWPSGSSAALNPLFLLLPGLAAVLVGAGLTAWGCARSPRCSRWWGRQWRRWVEHSSRGAASAWQLPAGLVRSLGRGAARYARFGG